MYLAIIITIILFILMWIISFYWKRVISNLRKYEANQVELAIQKKFQNDMKIVTILAILFVIFGIGLIITTVVFKL